MKTFPFHLQHDAMQCGVACLRMVSEYFGEQFTMDELDEDDGTVNNYQYKKLIYVNLKPNNL